MKKLVAVSILLTLLTAGAFAQFSIGVYADFYPNLLKTTTPTGDFADNTKTDIYQGAGTFDVFSSDGPFHGRELRLSLGYTDPDKKYGALLVIKGDSFLNRDANYFNAAGVAADTNQSILNFFAQPFDEWNVWGEVGVLKGFAGTSADRGIAGNARYNDPFSYALDNMWMSNNGVILPTVANPTIGAWTAKFVDTYNLAKYPDETGAADGGKPYVSVTANLAPLKIAVAGDLSRVEGISDSYNNVGAAVRVSGDKIADLISFDAIYKIAGQDPQTDDEVSEQPDGVGQWGHNFGLIANVSLFDTLGITAGYSGYTAAQEKKTTGDLTYVFPYYNGVDLRLAFTGVDKLLVSFNNNISFSTFAGESDGQRTQNGTAAYPAWNDAADYSAGYLGLYNALGVKYSITDDLFATLNLANFLTSTTVTNDSGSETITTVYSGDIFRAYAGAGYSFGSHVLLETGLVFDITSSIYDISNASASSYNGGTFTFAIPVRFKVAF